MSKSSAALYLEMPEKTISPVPHKRLDLYTVSVLIMIHRQYLHVHLTLNQA